MVSNLTSVIIPSRNEKYLQQTIQDLLSKSRGDIEIKAVLDGYWPPIEKIVNDIRVSYIHFSDARGMRNAINSGVAVSNGEFILKCDAHCMFGNSYDEILKRDCESNWVVVPRRYALDPEKWEIIDNPKYPIDYMYLDREMHGQHWIDKNKDQSLKDLPIDDLMSAQGSCWYMRRTYYDWLELMDEENYGKFASEFQEVGLKCWLSGGRVVVNKKTWYAHWHKTESRGYSLASSEFEKGNNFALNWLTKKNWHRQRLQLKWLIKKFAPVPTWTGKI